MNFNPADKHGGKRKRESAFLLADHWETVFRTAQVPIFIEDITSIRQAVAEVKAAGVKDFGNWLEAHPEFIATTIANLEILDVNDAAVEASGARDKDDLIYSLERMVVPETLPSFKAILMALARGEELYRGETRYQTLDGRPLFTLNQCLLPSFQVDGRSIMVLTATEITDLKMARKVLKETEERYRVLVERAHDLILCHDLKGTILFVNNACQKTTGWTQEELLGRNVQDLVPERVRGELRERMKKRTDGFAGTLLYETLVLGQDGREIPMEISTTMVAGATEESDQIIAVMRDISERKSLQMRILNAQKAASLGSLAGGLAHDFNNLLATIMGNAELLGEEKQLGIEAGEFLNSILAASNQAAELCQQMLAYSGDGHFAMERVDLSSVIRKVSRIFQISVGGPASLNLQLAEELPAVNLDVVAIRQVIMGLVTNAVEAMGEKGGELVIRTGRRDFPQQQLLAVHCNPLLEPGQYVYCAVRDCGEGMAPETLERLFDPFFSTRFPGRGLGLSSALGVMKGHGGGVMVETEPQVGSTLTLLFPEAPAIQTRKGRSRAKKAPDNLHLQLAGKLVLLVDEDPAVRKVCESYLRRLGCGLLSVGNGPDAVRIFSQRYDEVDLVILDLGMAGMDGVATLRRLRVIDPAVRVIFSTGSSEDVLRGRISGLQYHGFIGKPFKLAGVRQALAQALDSTTD